MRRDKGLAGPSYEDLLKRAESRPSDAQDPNAGVLNAIPVRKPVAVLSAAADVTNNNGTASGSDTTHSHTHVSTHAHVRTPSSSSPLSATETIAHPPPAHRRSSSAGGNKLVRKDYQNQNQVDTQAQDYSTQNENRRQKRSKEEKEMFLSRRPPATPVLLPAHRYCGTEELVKPYRAHHCRMCGKVDVFLLSIGWILKLACFTVCSEI
jgi:palmitoyltransferase